MNCLSLETKKRRDAAAKRRRIQMLCNRLDRQVTNGERYRKGATRKTWLDKAAETREELRKIDH